MFGASWVVLELLGRLGALGSSWVVLELLGLLGTLGAEIPDRHLDRLQDAQDA